jgi:1-aminocyclopropane-1-carboxylate deaminase/D-cysteine desulfhydrase-like pyridoxal-dependent ACC family enzyme
LLGRYPTPVQRIEAFSSPDAELWVKRDDLTSDLYGGNKVRKLEHILTEATRRGARRLLTVGAAGSHHVLATTVHGRRAGFDVAALLAPQPMTEHAENNLRAAIGEGLDAHAVPHLLTMPFAWAQVARAGDYVVAPGGSSVAGTVGYFDAAGELLEQIDRGALPCPDLVITALGSGGTAAGLLAGLVAGGFRGMVLGVRIFSQWLGGRWPTLNLARAVLRRRRPELSREKRRVLHAELHARLCVEGRYLGRGYGFPTPAGERAHKLAAEQGLVLEPTYTAKAFAAALDRVTQGGFKRVLFWHTFSSAPLQPLLAGAPSASELPAALMALLLRTAPNW